MDRQVITIGFEIPGFSSKEVNLESDQSLLDYDIVVFNPDISSFIVWSSEKLQAKPSLNETRSFMLRQSASRWRQALLEAFDQGKTVFIYMPEAQDVFLDTGRREYSGTGRNRHTTNIVEPFNNYSMLPFRLTELASARGKEIRPATDLNVLAAYWAEFGTGSSYNIHFRADGLTPLLVTRTGNKPVGGVIRGKAGSGKGAVVLLPMLHYDRVAFTEKKENKTHWTKPALDFGRKLVSTFLAIDEALKAARQVTPPPGWLENERYRFSSERNLEGSVTTLTKQVEEIQAKRSEVLRRLEREQELRRLLFEKGPALEDAILEALRLLGLKAERYRESDSEFDVVFTWKDQRFLGEAEGRDSKAISIDKMSQLERNVSEDFARDEVKVHAKGILFANAFRLQKPSDRSEFFTEKCMTAAARAKVALVRTPDLFEAAKHVKETRDVAFAERCVEAIARAEGTIVEFPAPPNVTSGE